MSSSTATEHPLQTPWTFYFDKKLASKQADFDTFHKNLTHLGQFNTLEGFWRHYAYLTSPDALPLDTNYYMFRKDFIPAWETFPRGGCWIIKVRKRNGVINRMWEELLFSCVGELFEEPDAVGVVLSARSREDVISVWNADNHVKPEARIKIGERLKSLLNLDENTVVEYKFFFNSLKDGSTFRNALPYVFAVSNGSADSNGIPSTIPEHSVASPTAASASAASSA